MNWNFDEIVPREGTDSIKYDWREKVFGRGDLIPLWVADMDFKTPSFITDRLKSRTDHEIFGYTYRSNSYFDTIRQWLARRHQWDIDSESICFCPGIVPALNISTLTFTRPDDSIIIQSPVYTPFFQAVESHGRELILNPLKEIKGKWTMDFRSLRESIKGNTRMLILSNPHNPVGRCWTKTDLEELAQICLENNILILSDEIHCDLLLPGSTHIPVASLSQEIADITVTCIAPSKTFNLAGLSTASVIISNPVLRKYFKKKIDNLHIGNGNIFGNIASEYAYSDGDEWVDELMKYIENNVNFVENYCKENIPEIIPVRPEATYMIWLDCRELNMSGKDLAEFFINKAGVGLNEGSGFGPGGEGFMRMNIGSPLSIITIAMNKIHNAVKLLRETRRNT